MELVLLQGVDACVLRTPETTFECEADALLVNGARWVCANMCPLSACGCVFGGFLVWLFEDNLEIIASGCQIA